MVTITYHTTYLQRQCYCATILRLKISYEVYELVIKSGDEVFFLTVPFMTALKVDIYILVWCEEISFHICRVW